jgi:hypothetical protein
MDRRIFLQGSKGNSGIFILQDFHNREKTQGLKPCEPIVFNGLFAQSEFSGSQL